MTFGRILNYDVVITPSDNKGFVVRVGCATLVFSSTNELIEAMTEYFENPKELEQKFSRSEHCRSPINQD